MALDRFVLLTLGAFGPWPFLPLVLGPLARLALDPFDLLALVSFSPWSLTLLTFRPFDPWTFGPLTILALGYFGPLGRGDWPVRALFHLSPLPFWHEVLGPVGHWHLYPLAIGRLGLLALVAIFVLALLAVWPFRPLSSLALGPSGPWF